MILVKILSREKEDVVLVVKVKFKVKKKSMYKMKGMLVKILSREKD